MNKERRKAIEAATALVEEARTAVEAAREAVETIRDEEQEYYDNMPESLQGGDKGQAAEEVCSRLDDAMSDLESFDFDSVVAALEEASA